MSYLGRYIYTQVGAMLVTFILFLIMQGFLSTGYEVSSKNNGNSVDFIRVKQIDELQIKQPLEPRPQKPPKPIARPQPLQQQPQMANSQTAALESLATAFSISEVVVKPGLNINPGKGFGKGSGDTDYLPLVKVPPMYPRKALRSGVEGYVLVAFTITAKGQVKSPRVIAAKPKGIFEEAAINAVLKFKYRPRIVNGQAVEVPNVQDKFTFKVKR